MQEEGSLATRLQGWPRPHEGAPHCHLQPGGSLERREDGVMGGRGGLSREERGLSAHRPGLLCGPALRVSEKSLWQLETEPSFRRQESMHVCVSGMPAWGKGMLVY